MCAGMRDCASFQAFGVGWLRQLSFVRPGVLWRREGRRVSDAIVRWESRWRWVAIWHGMGGLVFWDRSMQHGVAWRSMA
jgi:hypothetical protein